VNKYEGEHSSVWEWTGFERGTALHRAYRYRNLSAVRLLLAHGADPELRYRLHTDEIPESSALEIALRNQDTELVAILQGHLKSRDGTQKSNL
jgi:ankyrin repeat protein